MLTNKEIAEKLKEKCTDFLNFEKPAVIPVEDRPEHGFYSEYEEAVEIIMTILREEKKMMTINDSTAWCPQCNDEMFMVDNKQKAENIPDMYYCIGCNETFVFGRVKK